MRRRNGSTQNTRTPESTATQQEDRDRRSRQRKRHGRWSTSDAISAAVGHPLFGFVLFLIIFPGWTLLSTAQRRCTEGHLPGCRHNDPAPVLARTSQQQLYLPNWRLDRRCGSSFPSSADQQSSICDPFSATPCCSQWGWCGSGPNYCVQAVKAPYNHSGSGKHCWSPILRSHTMI